MKIFSATHDFNYAWDEVSRANWLKYCPWNKESSHVVAVDTLSRRVDASTGILRTERLITCRQPSPKWLQPFLGGQEFSHVYEVSYVKPPTRKAALTPSSTVKPPHVYHDTAEQPVEETPSVTMTSYNLTWADVLSVRETVTYTPSPEDPKVKTRFQQEAKITALCGGWQKIKEKIESFTVERFGQNAVKGRMGFEEVLEASRRAFREEREKQGQRVAAAA